MPSRITKPVSEVLNDAPPASIAEAIANWPIHTSYTPSASNWRDELLYFLLPDRFAAEGLSGAPLDRRDPATAQANVAAARPAGHSWDRWCESGSSRYQGGTIRGITQQLPYLQNLGVTTVWVGPVFKQRIEDDTYHGYGIQHFFDVDPRFGSRADLVDLVQQAHARGMRIILDIIFNHSGTNWLYSLDESAHHKPPFRRDGFYEPTYPRSGMGHGLEPGSDPPHENDFVWPSDLRQPDNYWNKGKADLGAGDPTDDLAEHKIGDFESLKSFNTTRDETLAALITIYQYWISLTDCDGFRIDTVKHVGMEAARNWCNAITEHSESLGKDEFFLLGEMAGGDLVQSLYLAAARNIDAALDIVQARTDLTGVAKGLADPGSYFDNFKLGWNDGMGSHRVQGDQHVIVLDDHDHVFGEKVRFSADAPNEHQSAAATAIQLFSLGIPCIYYGTEQALRGLPREHEERNWLTSRNADWLLREAMFGPAHPRKTGWDGAQGETDPALPGFGPEGTVGQHAFDQDHPAYRRIAAIAKIRALYSAARRGRQYTRNTRVIDGPFSPPKAGEMIAWSRILDDEEVLVLVNTNGTSSRGGWVEVDPRLAGMEMNVACDTSQLDTPNRDVCGGGSQITLPVAQHDSHWIIDVPPLQPSEVLILVNRYLESA